MRRAKAARRVPGAGSSGIAKEKRIIRATILVALAMGLFMPLYIILFLHPSLKKLVISKSESESRHIADHLADAFSAGPHPIGGEQVKSILQLVRKFGIWKLKIYSAEGRVIYSTDPQEIGRLEGEKHSLAGGTYSEFVRKGALSPEGREVARDVVETYVPLFLEGRVAGAVEIYLDVTDSVRSIGMLMSYSSASLGLAALGFIAVIVLLSAMASRIMEDNENATRALRLSEDRYRTLVEGAMELVVRVDAQGAVTFVNDYAALKLNRPKEEILGRKMRDFLSAGHHGILEGLFERSMRGEAQTDMEVDLMARGDGAFTCEARFIPEFRGGEFSGIVSVMRDVTESKRARKKELSLLKELGTLFNNLPVGIAYLDRNLDFLSANPFFLALMGVDKAAPDGKPLFGSDGSGISSGGETLKKKLLSHMSMEEFRGVRESVRMEWRVGDFQVNIMLVPEMDEKGETARFMAVAEDVTEKKRAEEKLLSSLKEKDFLLKEVHHRVKNNLQVVSSLLALHSRAIEGEGARDLLRESRDRVRSMALIHEELYQSGDLARIDFSVYLRKLVDHLLRSYGAGPSTVDVTLNASGVSLGIDKAVPCGLLINELISNALKHAFPEGRRGEISVDFTASGGLYTIRVEDDGVGLPADVDLQESGSLGMKLVSALVQQIEGTLEVGGNGRTRFEITFEAPEHA